MDVTIVAVPYVETVEAIMAPALLKSVLATHNIRAVAIDLNIEIVNRIEHHPRKQQILDFFFSQVIHPEAVEDIEEIINYCSHRILQYNTPTIAMSMLIYSGQIFTRWLCARIKTINPAVKIVVGGTGIKNFVAEDKSTFCEQARQLGLIDDYIIGDGELSLVEYLKGNYNYPGINNNDWLPLANLNDLPFPDYSDYDFSQYKDKEIPINDSRGCIKNCEFCDVIEHWKKFQYRTADIIFEEMLYQIDQLGISYFSFRSALTNGNMKEFNKLLDLIVDYNSNKPREKQIGWNGYFIIRNAKFHTEDLWKKISLSNGLLLVGVESVVSRVRHQLGKTFEDDDIDHNLKLSQQYGVPLILLMIVAYPTETLQDFEYTKQWFRNHKQYANNCVKFVNLSFASILPGTQLARKSDEYSIKKGSLPSIWINQNLSITTKQRLDYLRELRDIVVNECGFNAETSEQTIEHSTTDDTF